MKLGRGLLFGVAGLAAWSPLALLSLRTGSVTAAPAAPAAAPAGDMARIQQYIQTHCTECHGDKTKKADLTLNIYKDEQSILKDAKVWEGLLEQVQEGEMPPKKKPRPPMGDTEAFLKSVNSIFEKAHTGGKIDPGHVTVRRLNRTEYNNTIRDLVGVDFQPAEDFPSDDVGHGFDNIGEVLTISPVLMERYLAAAETIMNRAIIPDPPKPPNKWQGAKYLEPAGRNVPDKEFRPIDKGNLNTPWDLSLEGEYIFKLRAYSKSPDGTPAKVSLTIDGVEAAKFEVPAAEEKPGQQLNEQRAAKEYEFKVTAKKGQRRFAVNLTNESPADVAKEQRRTLVVHHFQLSGPLDPRPASQKTLLAVDEKLSKPQQTRQVLKRFVDRAYRRPATDVEVDRLVKLAEEQEAAGKKWEAAIQFAMQAVLVSPKFLFRLELDGRPEGTEVRPLDDYQLASRLSYFLWSTMPDEELLNLAAKKQLAANLDAQVRRMLKDPKSEALVDNFAMQWLELRRLAIVQPDTTVFQGFDDRLRQSMLDETKMFIDSIIKEDRSILDMIDSDYSFMDERLARHYGIADTNGNWLYQKPDRPRGEQIPRGKMVRVKLPANGPRGGLLTQASILTVTSNPTRTSPVKRGKFVLEQILGTPPPPPPPNVPELKVEKGQLTGTLRQKMEQHRADPACANCHAKLDPMGFAMENFDAVGAFRSKEGGAAIDASGVLPDGKTFNGITELRAILKAKKGQFTKCLAEKMMVYALGRGLEYYDRPTLNKITTAVDKDGYKFSTLVVEIVKSDPFRLKK